MSWDEQQRRRPEREREQRARSLRDQNKRHHEQYMKQQADHYDRLREKTEPRHGEPIEGAPPVVWFFGGIGALFGAVNPPLQWDGFGGGVLGFLVGGFLGGFLSERRWGRVILWIVGLGFVGLVAFAIHRAR